MSGQEDGQAEPPAPPMQANDLPLVAQAVPPASYIFSHLLSITTLSAMGFANGPPQPRNRRICLSR